VEERIPFRATSAAAPYAEFRLPVSILLDNVRSMYREAVRILVKSSHTS
jgi:hypothetical protein